MLLGIDIGTTNSKVGLFGLRGETLSLASRETETLRHRDGFDYYDPEKMWKSIADGIREVLAGRNPHEVEGIGITSMAETGLLVDRHTGEARSVMMPWFDSCSQPQAERIAKEADPAERFKVSGLANSFKLGLAKILWLKDREPALLDEGAVWLSASGYIAWRLSRGNGF